MRTTKNTRRRGGDENGDDEDEGEDEDDGEYEYEGEDEDGEDDKDDDEEGLRARDVSTWEREEHLGKGRGPWGRGSERARRLQL